MSENRLFDAAANGDLPALNELLGEDPFLLDRVSYTCYNKTPLHVATMKGHLPFVQKILNLNPELAQELDSQQSSALHLASAKGNLQIVKELLLAAPDMCLSRDFQGKNPIHIAAMKGQVEVLDELVRMVPLAAREKFDRGQTVLHLCVKHYRLEALKILVLNLSDLVNAEDDDGDTVLHLAVRDKQIETIHYLSEHTNIDLTAKNSKNQTPLQMLEQDPTDTTNLEIRKILRSGLSNTHNTQTQPIKWLTKKRDAIMVVAILIATMAFQAGVSPPGGVWQEDSTHDPNGKPLENPRKAGESVMAYNHPKFFKNFTRSNTVAFVSSLSIILFLISGLPFRRRLFMWFLMVIMWLVVSSIAVTYGLAIAVVTPHKDMDSLSHVIETAISVWCGVMGVLLVGNTLRLIDRWLKNRGVTVWRPKRFRSFVQVREMNKGGV